MPQDFVVLDFKKIFRKYKMVSLDEEWFIFQTISDLSYYLSIVELLSK
jgi:hypothetical protein